jgi:hypothetical protein
MESDNYYNKASNFVENQDDFEVWEWEQAAGGFVGWWQFGPYEAGRK